jgi:putative transposase
MYLEDKKLVRKKCKRFNVPFHAHELTYSCYNGIPLFKSRLFCSFFVNAVEFSRDKYNFDVWAYVVMPEHVHILLYPKDKEYSISNILKSIKQSVSRKAINWFRDNDQEFLKRLAVGQKYQKYRFWQDGGGYDRNIMSYKAARNSVNYIHLNPVRRKLVENPRQWEYSSYIQCMGGSEGGIEICLKYFPRR